MLANICFNYLIHYFAASSNRTTSNIQKQIARLDRSSIHFLMSCHIDKSNIV